MRPMTSGGRAPIVFQAPECHAFRMRFAALADIHGNAHALEAVLADMAALGVDRAVNLGDVFSGPLDAARTAELMVEAGFPTIRGNHDRYLITQAPEDMGPSDRTAYEQLSSAQIDWIRQLPETCHVFDDVMLCHGTPRCDSRYWLEQVTSDGTVRPASRAEVEREAIGVDAGLILCAHTHIPRQVRLRDARLVVNPGSVGCPAYDDTAPVYHIMQTGTPTASYAILEQTAGTWQVTFRSVPYDHAAASALAAQNGREDWARALSSGWFEP